MSNFSQLGFENSHYEHTLLIREKAEIRKVAKYIAVAYLLTIALPKIFNYFILDLASSYKALKIIETVLTDPMLSLFYHTVVSIIIFTLPFLIVPMRLTLKLGDLISVKRPKKGLLLPFVLMGLGFCAFANIASNTITAILGEFGIGVPTSSYSSSKTPLEFIITFFAVAVVPAVVEEFAFRGIVLGALRKFGDGFSILISSLVFGLIHRNLAQIPFAFLMGVIMSFAVIKTGSIITSVLIHLLNNGLSLAVSTAAALVGSDMAKTVMFSLYYALCLIFFFMGLALLSVYGKELWQPKRTTHSLTTRQRVNCFFSQPVMIFNLVLSVTTALTLVVVK